MSDVHHHFSPFLREKEWFARRGVGPVILSVRQRITRLRVLFLTHRLPYPPNRGDRIRAYHILHALRDRAAVDLVSLVHDADEASQAGELRDLTDSVHLAPVSRLRNHIVGACKLPTAAPLTHALLDSPAVLPALRRLVTERTPDVVLAYGSGMARFALEQPLAGLPLVVDMVDVDSCKWRALAAVAPKPMRWIYRREALRLAQFEARAARQAVVTLVVNERERAALAEIAPGVTIEVVQCGVDFEHFRPSSGPTSEASVIFCGVLNYAPNEQGAVWLAQQVWPQVRQRCHDARLRIVGSHPTRRVRELAADDSSIEVTGHVADVRPYLWSAAVATAPLHTARGVQMKVLEAVAAGLPAIVTSVVAEGLPSEILAACRVADSASAFADAIVQCLEMSPPSRRRIAQAANLSALSWPRCLAPLSGLLERAVSNHSGRRRSNEDRV